MSLFSNKKEQTLADKLAGFKGVFTAAYNGAVELKEEIEYELQANKVAVANAKAVLADTEKLAKENEEFISNLSKLV